MTILNVDTDAGYVEVNSLDIEEGSWAGDYFQNVPIRVKAVARPGYSFSHWTIGSTATTAEIEINLEGAVNLTPVFEQAVVLNDNIIINEINYNASDDFDTGDWVELHNRGTAAVDISGWIFRDNDDEHAYVLPEGTMIEGEGYLVLVRRLDDFQALHPDLTNVIGEFDFGLSSSGDMARIYDADGLLVDSISFLPDAPWPTEANGEGPTLELANPSLDNDLVENWAILHPFGSPGITNVDPNSTDDLLDVLSDFGIAPNPSSGPLNVYFQLTEAGHMQFDLFDMNGRLVHRIDAGERMPGQHQLTDDQHALPKGMYLLRAMVDGQVAYAKRWVRM